MSKDNVYFACKIDCEATQQSINDTQLGERATRGFAEVLEKENLLGTFLAIATDLEASRELYVDLAERGHEIGLHVHPADLGYEEFLGIYGPDDQQKILLQAADRFAQVMGYRPKAVDIGYHSANDYTYQILNDLGFTHGNLSQPSRILPECASVWAGAQADIHYTSAFNRLLPGELNLIDIPCINDPQSRIWGGKHPQDLKVESVDAKNHWYTIKKAIDRQIKKDVPTKYIMIQTHNVFDYSDPKNFRRETLEKVIQHTKNIIASVNYNFKGVTLKELADQYRRKCPLDKIDKLKLTLDTSGR